MKKKTVLKVIFTPFFAILLAALAVGNGVALYYFDTITEFFHGSSTVFEGEKVPDILLSGNHQNIDKWRKQKSLDITKSKRPDLLLK